VQVVKNRLEVQPFRIAGDGDEEKIHRAKLIVLEPVYSLFRRHIRRSYELKRKIRLSVSGQNVLGGLQEEIKSLAIAICVEDRSGAG